ncbi:MAG TPA: hypothetical protein VFG86_24880, partial [Chloroflexota bacterium]|nr:hypothetical protein [Chloroflexota bacterium]
MRFELLLALLMTSLLPAVASAEPNGGTVSGQVVNKTSGGGPTAGITVALISFGRKEQAPLGQVTTTADEAGHYSFTGVDRDPNLVYLLIARYADISYPSPSPFQLQEPSMQVDIPVYESTSNDDALQLERLNLLVLGADQGTLQFMQMGAIVNNGDRTFVTANPQDQQLAQAVKFALPRGALGAQMQSGFDQDDVIPGVGGIQVTTPLLPGRHEFALSFQLPYNGSSADLSLQVPYPTAAFNVYVPANGPRLDSSAVTASGNANLGGQQYALYTAANLPKAAVVASSVSGLTGASGSLGPTQLALLSLGVVLLVLGGGVVLLGARGRSHTAPAQPSDAASLEHERLELVVRLAALDERHAAG